MRLLINYSIFFLILGKHRKDWDPSDSRYLPLGSTRKVVSMLQNSFVFRVLSSSSRIVKKIFGLVIHKNTHKRPLRLARSVQGTSSSARQASTRIVGFRSITCPFRSKPMMSLRRIILAVDRCLRRWIRHWRFSPTTIF